MISTIMGRTLNVFAWILLGAMAAGLGTGFFLFQANHERAALAAEADSAKKQAADMAAQSKTLADEANKKLGAASDEVKRAQELVKKYDEERGYLAKAEPLTRSKLSANWKEWINIPLGYTLRMPTGSGNAGDTTYFDFGWLKIEPYTETRETELRTQASSTGDVAYFVNGHLLIGTRGEPWVLRDQIGGTSTILMTADPGSTQGEKTLMEVLSSFTFR